MDESLKNDLRGLFKKAADLIDRDSFGQEPNYTAAFFGKLKGETFSLPSGEYVQLDASISNDRGPGSAEFKTGIDIGLILKWVNDGVVYEKALLMQAKNHVDTLNASEILALFVQCAKMSKITSSYVVMDCPFDRTVPKVYETRPVNTLIKPPFSLDDYLIDWILPCSRGDYNPKVVDLAKRANRALTITTNSPKPTNTATQKNDKPDTPKHGKGPGKKPKM